MDIGLRYFDGCPNWRSTYERLATVLEELGLPDVEIALERVESPEDADRLRFVGSPTVLINGRDAFPSQEGTLSSPILVAWAGRCSATPHSRPAKGLI